MGKWELGIWEKRDWGLGNRELRLGSWRLEVGSCYGCMLRVVIVVSLRRFDCLGIGIRDWGIGNWDPDSQRERFENKSEG